MESMTKFLNSCTQLCSTFSITILSRRLVTKEADRIDIPVKERQAHHYQWRSCHEHARIRFETERRGWGWLRIPSRWSLDISWPGIDRHNWSASGGSHSTNDHATPLRLVRLRRTLRTTSPTGRTRPRWLCELDSTDSGGDPLFLHF